MFIFSASIIIRPVRPVHKHYEKELHALTENVCLTCRTLGCDTSVSQFYFHPDEEAEVRDFELEGSEIRLLRECYRFRSVALLGQIALSVAALYHAGQWAAECQINEPLER